MTETELVLASLTTEELDDAARYMGHMLDRWRESRRTVEADRRDPLLDLGYHGTEGPIHAIRALDVAIVREQLSRGGAEPWDAQQGSEDHPSRATILFYRERLELNPDLGVIPRLSAAGALERVCPSCGVARPLSVAFWAWQEGTLATTCRECARVRQAAGLEALAAIEAGTAEPPANIPADIPGDVDELGGWAP